MKRFFKFSAVLLCLLIGAAGLYDVELLKLLPSFVVLWFLCPHFNILGGSCGDTFETIVYCIYRVAQLWFFLYLFYAIYRGVLEFLTEHRK